MHFCLKSGEDYPPPDLKLGDRFPYPPGSDATDDKFYNFLSRYVEKSPECQLMDVADVGEKPSNERHSQNATVSSRRYYNSSV